MKKIFKILCLSAFTFFVSCESEPAQNEQSQNVSSQENPTVGQSGVQDDVSNPNVVQVAVSSKDHTTLVAAVKAAELVDALSNAGPFTVFAPTNAAFEKLPAGTVEELLKPEKKEDLVNILQYHVYVGNLSMTILQDGQTLGQVNGGNVKISKKDGKVFVNDAQIVASINTSNGIIHVIDGVLLPK